MNEKSTGKDPFILRNGTQIFPDQMEEFEKIIHVLIDRIPAQLIILLDRNGQVITRAGECDPFRLIAFGSLISADLAASQAIAEYSDEYQDTQTILREGKHYDSLISEAGEHLILFVQFSTQISLGWARLLVKKAAKEIREIFEKSIPNSQASIPDDGGSFVHSVDDELKKIWNHK
jgi:predicted regulator of Ras-like GTPase activity (Roadblock/LC7/MglB family)